MPLIRSLLIHCRIVSLFLYATAARSTVAGRMFKSRFCDGATAAATYHLATKRGSPPKAVNCNGGASRATYPYGREVWRDGLNVMLAAMVPCAAALWHKFCVLLTILLATQPK